MRYKKRDFASFETASREEGGPQPAFSPVRQPVGGRVLRPTEKGAHPLLVEGVGGHFATPSPLGYGFAALRNLCPASTPARKSVMLRHYLEIISPRPNPFGVPSFR
jgi:hypothetical protein